AGGSARADMRLVPVPALHMRLQVDELDPQTYRQVSVTQTILGNYQDQASVSTQQIISGRTSENGDGGVGDQSSGPLVMEVDGLRPGASDVQTLDVRGIAPAGVVSGIVRLEGNASPPLGVRVFLRNASKGAGFREDVGSDGNLSFSSDEIEPGVYEVSSAAPGGLELRSVSASGTKVTGRKIEIRNGSDLRLILTLARGVNARVNGIVERGGRPAPGMMVVLVAEDLRDLTEFRRDQSDSDGSFSMNQVSPGKYTVVAVKDWDLEWGKPEVIHEYLAGGTSVDVAGGEERDIKVTAK